MRRNIVKINFWHPYNFKRLILFINYGKVKYPYISVLKMETFD
jgi:hypothetical protein